jgi:carbonic anhydrase
MSRITESILSANREFAAAFRERARVPRPPRKVAVLTCMDARLDPGALAGLEIGDADVIRNAGGLASEDAIRSLVLSASLHETREWVVIHHTDCGMEKISEDRIREMVVKAGLSEAELHGWMSIRDGRESVRADVGRIRSHPLVSPEISVHGFLYDVKTGRLESVEPAL